MLAGLMSRWMTLWRWAWSNALATAAAIPDGLVHRELLLAVDPVTERLALDVGHRVEQEAVSFPRVVKRQDVGVVQVGGNLDLGEGNARLPQLPPARASGPSTRPCVRA